MRRARPLPERHPKEMSRFSVSIRVILAVALRADENYRLHDDVEKCENDVQKRARCKDRGKSDYKNVGKSQPSTKPTQQT
jgi:hypothetical protein